MPCAYPCSPGPTDVKILGRCACKPFDHPLPPELSAQGVTDDEWGQVLAAGNKIERTIGLLTGFWSVILCTVCVAVSILHDFSVWGAMGAIGFPSLFRFCMYPPVVQRLHDDIFSKKGVAIKYINVCCSDGFGFSVNVSENLV